MIPRSKQLEYDKVQLEIERIKLLLDVIWLLPWRVVENTIVAEENCVVVTVRFTCDGAGDVLMDISARDMDRSEFWAQDTANFHIPWRTVSRFYTMQWWQSTKEPMPIKHLVAISDMFPALTHINAPYNHLDKKLPQWSRAQKGAWTHKKWRITIDRSGPQLPRLAPGQIHHSVLTLWYEDQRLCHMMTTEPAGEALKMRIQRAEERALLELLAEFPLVTEE